MTRLVLGPIILSLLLLTPRLTDAQPRKILKTAVIMEIARPIQEGALLHWRITNNLDVAVYVYDFYLWGPAYHIEQSADKVTIDSTPVTESPGCPPNRFPPLLLLIVGPGRTIEGDFTDAAVSVQGRSVSLRVAVGENPYTVVEEAKQFAKSKCKHSPYDAIVRWGAILESNAIQLQ